MKFTFNTISFFIGAISATVLWWGIWIFKPLFNQLLTSIRNKIQGITKQQIISKAEAEYRKLLYIKVQDMHMASSLFSLDDICIPTRLLAPPIVSSPGSPNIHRDIVEETIPYMPNRPELGTFYNAHAISLLEALSIDMNVVIIGAPGSGKSTALATLVATLSGPATTESQPLHLIPFLIHAADIPAPLVRSKTTEHILSSLIELIYQSFGNIRTKKFAKFTKNAFIEGKALLLIDGMDELSRTGMQLASKYIATILEIFPKTKIIATGSPEYLDGILALDFLPLAIMPWNEKDQAQFLSKWTSLWKELSPKTTAIAKLLAQQNTRVLNQWIATDNITRTPLEYTLRVWGSYAGDIRSTKITDLVEASIKRLIPERLSIEDVSIIALLATENESPFFTPQQGFAWLKIHKNLHQNQLININSSGTEISEYFEEENTIQKKEKDKSKSTSQLNAKSNLFSSLCSSGLLVQHSENRLRFANPIFQSFLTAKALQSNQYALEKIINQTPWSTQTYSLAFYAATGMPSDAINKILNHEDPILHRPALTAGWFLQMSEQTHPMGWHNSAMTGLVRLLQDDDNPIGLRAEAMLLLSISKDKNVAAFFRQSMQSESQALRMLSILGAGLLRDTKSIEFITQAISNSNDTVKRAACLALTAIGTQQALETVAFYLLRGDEQLRIFAAQSLANQDEEGWEALREGLNSEDILVRRAIVSGLSRIPDDWSTELLQQVQHTEKQWAVQNLASEVLQFRQNPNLRLPNKLSPPHENPWLIEYAGKYGMGIAPGSPATDILLLSLKDKNPEFFVPAMQYLRKTPTDGVFAAIYPFLYGTDLEAREAVYQTLIYMAMGGASLPDPHQFGLG